jgi:hypothetical protein
VCRQGLSVAVSVLVVIVQHISPSAFRYFCHDTSLKKKALEGARINEIPPGHYCYPLPEPTILTMQIQMEHYRGSFRH